MSVEMLSVTFDGVPVQVAKGTPMIEAAKLAGIMVPHYCYHPSLPSPAVCRMCLVHVEKMPKLVPACVTPLADGQVIHVHSPDAIKAREGVLEFLLIHHPLDCPICDQAGECKLQDFVFDGGRANSRYTEPKRYNPVEDFGPDILYVPNRCIVCTRCVRFMEHVAEEPVLNVSERGDRAFIGIDESQRLDHPWSGNVVDLCPVGSLISKDFLHKARAWELDGTPSICTGCTQGCNITIDTRDEVVVRLRPRPNLEVNRHFICDAGRADYHWMNRGDRVDAPLVRDDGAWRATDWESALDQLAAIVKGTEGNIVLLSSGRTSCESLGWAARLVEQHQVTSAMLVPLGEEAPIGSIPNLARRAEQAANLEGARMLGLAGEWTAAIQAAGKAALVVVLDAMLSDADAAVIARAAKVVHFATVADPRLTNAVLIVPVASVVETEGVLVNRDGRAQRVLPARPAPGMARPGWWVAAEAWARVGSGRRAPATADEALRGLAPFASLSAAELGLAGRVLDPTLTGAVA